MEQSYINTKHSTPNTEMNADDVATMKNCIRRLSALDAEFRETLDTLKTLMEKYNAASDEERETNPELWAVRAEWERNNDKKRMVGIRLYHVKMCLYALTGDNLSLWPRHLRYQHPMNAGKKTSSTLAGVQG